MKGSLEVVFVSPVSGGQTIFPTNTCFDDTLDFIDALYFSGVPKQALRNLFVVHAICLWPGHQPGTEHRAGERFAHGWIERGKFVIQCGIIDEERRWYALERESFYQHMRVQRMTRYSTEEALRENFRTNSYGPWLPEYLALCKGGVMANEMARCVNCGKFGEISMTAAAAWMCEGCVVTSRSQLAQLQAERKLAEAEQKLAEIKQLLKLENRRSSSAIFEEMRAVLR